MRYIPTGFWKREPYLTQVCITERHSIYPLRPKASATDMRIKFWYAHRDCHINSLGHVCISKLTIIVADNALSPWQHQAINWTNDLILSIGSKLEWNLNRNLYIFIQENTLQNIVRKLAAFLLGPNVLTRTFSLSCLYHCMPHRTKPTVPVIYLYWKVDPHSKVHGANTGPSGADRTQAGPTLVPWTLLSGHIWHNSYTLPNQFIWNVPEI